MTTFGSRLIQSAREAVAIAKGEADPATYRVHVPAELDVAGIRKGLGLTQAAFGVGTQNGPRYTLRFCRAFDGAHLAKRSERGGWRIGIGPEVIAGEIDMLPTER